jgi:AcrR family transcriptional regulator
VPRPRTISDEAILEAATRVIGRVGPARLTLAAVASEAGLAPATLIQRFGSRRAMLLALHAHDADQVRERLCTPPTASGSILTHLIEDLLAMAAPLGEPVAFSNHLAVLHQDLADPAFLVQAQAHARAMREAIHAALELARTRHELREDVDLDQLARSVQTVYNGALLTWAIERDGALAPWLRRELEALTPRAS